MLNGIEYTGSSSIGITPGGVRGQLLGIDAVREFNVLSDTYSAEYGKRAGAQVSVVTQSGSNQLHGSVFEFLRNNKLDARNSFDRGPTPLFRRNQFGGSLGGPINKDRAFLFGNYEGFRHRLGLSDVAFVPDNNARQGSLPCGVIYTTPASRTANCTDLNAPIPVPSLDSRMLRFMGGVEDLLDFLPAFRRHGRPSLLFISCRSQARTVAPSSSRHRSVQYWDNSVGQEHPLDIRLQLFGRD